MTRVGILFDPRFAEHDPGAGHPERPVRLAAVRAGLEHAGAFTRGVVVAAEDIDDATLESVHPRAYVERVRTYSEHGRRFVDDPDCAMNEQTCEIARLAAGGVVACARRVGRGELERGFCAVRPPGHHAERDRAMGFCFFANVALAAQVLRREFGRRRVLILDWDVHHGNGTQHIFEEDPDVLFVSLHGHPDYLYPGTGYAEERGRGPGEGFTLNVPLLPRTGDAEFRAAFEAWVTPAVEAFEPDALLISAGFDAHADDPLGNLALSDATFDWLTARALEWARRYCDGRVISVLEGGYNLDVLRRCVEQHVERLLAD